MPQIFSIHYYPINNNEVDLYNYSEGIFFTVSSNINPNKNNYKYMSSSGTHIGIYRKEECLNIMKNMIIKDLSEDKNYIAIVTTFNAKENDYYCTHSGPPCNVEDDKRWIYGYEKTEDGEKLVQKKIEKETYKILNETKKIDVFSK